jgi:hypothetical protein
MIQVLDKNTAESSEGWRVHFAGHSPMTWRIQYREGERHIEVKVEGGVSGKVFFSVYLADVQHWLSPDGEGPISPEDRKRVGKNIRAGLEMLNTPCRIE